MELDRDGKLARWAYCLSDNWILDGKYSGKVPRQTSLCALFWRAFVGVPLAFLFFALLLVTVVVMVVLGAIRFWYPLLLTLGIVMTGVVVVAGASYWLDTRSDGLHTQKEPSVFWEGLKAVKGKVCPIVKFK